jgi:hypothetical protein
MMPLQRKILTHGLLFILGLGFFMGWDHQLSVFFGFPGREVWRPLSVGWALLLLYDASRRLRRERQPGQSVDPVEAFDGENVPRRSASKWYATVGTVFRFLLFFAIVGAVGRPSLVAFVIVAAIFAVAVFLDRRERVSRAQ